MVRLMQASAHDLQLACLHLHHYRFTAVAPPSQWSFTPVSWLWWSSSTDAIDTQRYYSWGAQYHNHRNFTDYRNCKSLKYRCDLWCHSVGPLHIHCLGTWRPYCNPLLTNQDANYNLRRTLMTLLRQYRYVKAWTNGKCLPGRPNTIKHCLVTKQFTVWTPCLVLFDRVRSCLIVFGRVW